MADVEKLSPKAQALLENTDVSWVFDDVRDRIMGGDIEEIDDAQELILEELESFSDELVDYDDNQAFGEADEEDDLAARDEAITEPDGLDSEPAQEDTDDPDVDLDDLATELAEYVWAGCREAARAWDGETTDADRLLAAFEALADNDIAAGLYMDWADMPTEGRGGVLVWVNAWENLSPDSEADLRITYTAFEGHSDAEIASDLVAALRDAGLKPGEPADNSVVVPVWWRWHVEDAG